MIRLDLDDGRWASFLEGRPDAHPFHHPAWSRTLADTYGFRPFVLGIEADDGALHAAVPAMEVRLPWQRTPRWVSLPFTDHCSPLLAPGGDAGRFRQELEEARRAGGAREAEVRADLGDGAGRATTSAVIHHLPLGPDPDAVLARAHRSQVQRNVRKAEREGVEVRRAESATDLTGVFFDLHAGTRRRQGVPVQPRRFFTSLWDRLIAPGLGFVLIAQLGRTPVAGAVFLSWKGTLVYKYGASDPRHLWARPNHAIFREAIAWGCTHDCRTLDFGRTDVANEGLRAFKSAWGGVEAPLVYSSVGGAPSGGAARWSPMVRPVLRRLPPSVTRAVGQVLYKYAG